MHAASGIASKRPYTPSSAPPASVANRIVGVSIPVDLPWISGVQT
jgi:hypothetical protein